MHFPLFPRRTDVNAVTNWNAPLVWERTFDPVVIDSIYKKMGPRIAVVVFAVGKYVNRICCGKRRFTRLLFLFCIACLFFSLIEGLCCLLPPTRYTRFLQKFIESGEKHFFVGFNVTYYVHTDRKDEVPKVSCLYFCP